MEVFSGPGARGAITWEYMMVVYGEYSLLEGGDVHSQGQGVASEPSFLPCTQIAEPSPDPKS